MSFTTFFVAGAMAAVAAPVGAARERGSQRFAAQLELVWSADDATHPKLLITDPSGGRPTEGRPAVFLVDGHTKRCVLATEVSIASKSPLLRVAVGDRTGERGASAWAILHATAAEDAQVQLREGARLKPTARIDSLPDEVVFGNELGHVSTFGPARISAFWVANRHDAGVAVYTAHGERIPSPFSPQFTQELLRSRATVVVPARADGPSWIVLEGDTDEGRGVRVYERGGGTLVHSQGWTADARAEARFAHLPELTVQGKRCVFVGLTERVDVLEVGTWSLLASISAPPPDPIGDVQGHGLALLRTRGSGLLVVSTPSIGIEEGELVAYALDDLAKPLWRTRDAEAWRFGWIMRTVGDVDVDGVDDLAVTGRNMVREPNDVALVSGAKGRVLGHFQRLGLDVRWRAAE